MSAFFAFGEASTLRIHIPTNRILQRNQRLRRLHLFNRLQLINQHVLQLFNRAAHQLYEDVVCTSGVVASTTSSKALSFSSAE